MARSVFHDLMQQYAFWLFDAFSVVQGGLPVLNPLAGFTTMTSPEITAQTREIEEGNWHYPRTVIKNARISPITLTRGVRFTDHDFYRWIVTAIEGNTAHFNALTGGFPIGGPTPRRSLVMVHFLSRLPISPTLDNAARARGRVVAEGIQDIAQSAVDPGVLNALKAGAGVLGTFLGPFDIAGRLPGRAWLLSGCLPLRYKSGTDFDASSSGISIAELDIQPEGLDEVSLVG
jgi:hypothetical protein